jgi:hypothetical protein
LEELLPKDNENIPFLGPVEPSEPQGFSADQMIRCEECLRANPPTRVTCLYCVAPLPLTEEAKRLRKPVLRPPEKHQLGYNNILLSRDEAVSSGIVAEAAALLKLTPEDLGEILIQSFPLPVARTASREEADLVFERLKDLGLACLTLSVEDLGLPTLVKRVRSMRFEDEYLIIHPAGENTKIPWSDVKLLLRGRLFETRFETKELMTRKTENELLETSEFSRDELAIDFYTGAHPFTWRINTNGFDFSCLENDKTLIANENIGTLQRVLTTRALNAWIDDSYRRVRRFLDLVWPMEAETQSSGWRRERPGKLSVGTAMIKSNEMQFTRYSRLLHYFCKS